MVQRVIFVRITCVSELARSRLCDGIGTRAGTSERLCCCVCLSEVETFRRIGAAVRVEHLPSGLRGVVLRIVLEVCGLRAVSG